MFRQVPENNGLFENLLFSLTSLSHEPEAITLFKKKKPVLTITNDDSPVHSFPKANELCKPSGALVIAGRLASKAVPSETNSAPFKLLPVPPWFSTTGILK
jgi:hypothetical protein